MEPPIVTSPIFGNTPVAVVPKIAGWPWPALDSRSEQERHKFFSVAFLHLLLIGVPTFAVMVAIASINDVGMLGLVAIAPLAMLAAVAMALGQSWIVDNAFRERKSAGLVLWTPFYLQFYVLSRWAICWRPMVVIACGGFIYLSLIFYLMGDELASSLGGKRSTPQAQANQSSQDDAEELDAPAWPSATSRRSTRRNASQTTVNNTSPQHASVKPNNGPAENETVWTYESLMGPKARSSLESADSTITPFAGARASSPASSEPAVAADSAKTPLASQPVLSPVFEEDDGFREWSNRSGSYKVVAKLEAVESDFVALTTKDGRKIRVEISKLSSADRRFLETSW